MNPAAPATFPVSGPPGSARESQVAAIETVRLADGRALCARRWPGGGDHLLVLLHGLLDSSEGWTPLCEHFGCTRIAFDLPGFGYSDAPARGSIAGYASDVAAALEQFGARHFTVVGHSLGGAVAAALAEQLPDRVAALVLLAPAGFGQIRLAEAVSIPGLRRVVQAGLPLALSSRLAVTAGYVTMVAPGSWPERALVDRITSRGAASVDGAREGTRAVVEAGRARDGFHRRRVDYHGPVFAVWGDRDRLVPISHHKGVRVAFPQAHIQVWRGMGHHCIRQRPGDLSALVGRAAAAARPQSTSPPLPQITAA